MRSSTESARPTEDASRERALRFVKFLTAAVTPFHAVAIGSSRLEQAGFKQLDDSASWVGLLAPGGRYFYTRADSTLVAFAVGQAYTPGAGFKMVGAHTDSPCLKTKPITKASSGDGLTQVSVTTYGGGLWHTWFDRDLGIAGLVLLRLDSGVISKRLVAIHEGVLRVPSLCIHLQSASERESFAPNKETHLVPVLCMTPPKREAASASAEPPGKDAAVASAASPELEPFGAAQESELLRILAERLQVPARQIVSMDLSLFDAQPPALGGSRSEFVCGGRLDNLASSFVALEALVDAAASAPASEAQVSCIALFDHEEVGSASASGAGGPIMGEALSRIGEALGVAPGSELALRSLRRSFLLSLDNAHAVHPNWKAKHEAAHRPQMGGGLVIKSNANLRYATDSVTAFVVRELALRAGVPTQEFCVKNDCPCGSTIGPILSAALGVRTCDIGMPQLAMHSAREMMGAVDLTHCHGLLTTFFAHFSQVDEQLSACPPPRVE